MELRREGDAFCVYHWHDWKTTVEKLWFYRLPNGQFRLERISPPSGFGLVLDYDLEGRLSSVAQMIEGRRISFRYNKRGLVSELVLVCSFSSGRLFATYLYDEQDRLIEVRDATGAAMRYEYDWEGRMVSEVTRSGAVFQMIYDLNGRCVNTRGKDGVHDCRLQYAVDARVTLVTNSLGDLRAYEFNGSGQVLTEKRSNGAIQTTYYDELGRIVEEVDPLGRSTKFRYDEYSNTAAVVYPSGLTLEAHYDRDHQPIFLRQGRSIWRFVYADGQLITVVDPRRVEAHYGYDKRGFPNSLTEPSGNTVRIVADEAFARIRVSDEYGVDREENYDDLMRVVSVIEPDGTTYHFEYDLQGRLVQATVPSSPPKEYTYDATGYLATTTDEDGHTLRLFHDPHGHLLQIHTATGRIYKCVWDTEGRLASRCACDPSLVRAGSPAAQ